MTELSEINIKLKTQITLNNIQDVTNKIKRELTIINEMIRDKGNLSVSLTEANNSLIRIAQVQGIKSINELLTFDNDNDDILNASTVDGITQKLMSIMDN